MRHRTIVAATLAASLGVLALAPAAEAAWKGLRAFDCEGSRSNWNFDGLYGNYTTRAVRNFQRAKGIKADGVAGPETYKALGLRYRRTLKCGMGGNDVFLLQQALAASGFWYGGEGDTIESRPSAKPTTRPSARPTPAWTEPPILYTPAPLATEEPTPMPEETPMALPTAAPTFQEEEVENRPTLELHGGNWSVPLNAGSTNYDLSFSRPTWVGGGTLWLGDFGLGGELTMFNTTYVDYRAANGGLYFAQNTAMYDALAKLRFDRGFYQVFGGYRGIGVGNVNFGTLGVGMDRPLLGSWLWLQAKAQGGHDFNASYFLDGRAGLGLRFDPLGVDLGFRHFSYKNQAEPMFQLNGPVAEVKLSF